MCVGNVGVGDGEGTEEGCNLEEGVDMGECVLVFKGMRDEVAVLLPVVVDAVVSPVSEMLDVAVGDECEWMRLLSI